MGIMAGDKWGDLHEDRPMKCTLWAKWLTFSAAACTASRVLPIPPGPTRVSSWQAGSSRRRASSVNSSERPMKGVDCRGKLELFKEELAITSFPHQSLPFSVAEALDWSGLAKTFLAAMSLSRNHRNISPRDPRS